MNQSRINPELKVLLVKSFDSELTPEERERLARALSNSPELALEKKRLIKLRNSIGQSAGQFKPFFQARVLARIKAAGSEGSLVRLVESMNTNFRKVALVGVMAALILATVNMATNDEISVPAAFALQEEQDESPLQTPFELMTE